MGGIPSDATVGAVLLCGFPNFHELSSNQNKTKLFSMSNKYNFTIQVNTNFSQILDL